MENDSPESYHLVYLEMHDQRYDMDFYQMEQILTIAECGSISEAAKKLFVSQPTISYAVAKAESQLGAKLFDRSSYPLKLTYVGEKYVETALQMRLLYRNLQTVCEDAAHQAAGELRLGFPHNRSAQILPRILKEFRTIYPHVNISYFSGTAEKMFHQLYNGELDMCILTKVEQNPEFRYELLYDEELRAVALDGIIDPKYLSGKGNTLLSLQALTELPVLLPVEKSGLGKMLSLFFQYNDIRPNFCTQYAGNNVLYMLAGAGLGVAILPQNILDQSVNIPNLKNYALSEHGLGWSICAIVRKGHILSNVEKTLIRIIREKFADYPKELDLFPLFKLDPQK